MPKFLHTLYFALIEHCTKNLNLYSNQQTEANITLCTVISLLPTWYIYYTIVNLASMGLNNPRTVFFFKILAKDILCRKYRHMKIRDHSIQKLWTYVKNALLAQNPSKSFILLNPLSFYCVTLESYITPYIPIQYFLAHCEYCVH